MSGKDLVQAVAYPRGKTAKKIAAFSEFLAAETSASSHL